MNLTISATTQFKFPKSIHQLKAKNFPFSCHKKWPNTDLKKSTISRKKSCSIHYLKILMWVPSLSRKCRTRQILMKIYLHLKATCSSIFQLWFFTLKPPKFNKFVRRILIGLTNTFLISLRFFSNWGNGSQLPSRFTKDFSDKKLSDSWPLKKMESCYKAWELIR